MVRKSLCKWLLEIVAEIVGQYYSCNCWRKLLQKLLRLLVPMLGRSLQTMASKLPNTTLRATCSTQWTTSPAKAQSQCSSTCGLVRPTFSLWMTRLFENSLWKIGLHALDSYSPKLTALGSMSSVYKKAQVVLVLLHPNITSGLWRLATLGMESLLNCGSPEPFTLLWLMV